MVINRTNNFIDSGSYSKIWFLINLIFIFTIVSLVFYYIVEINSFAGFGLKSAQLKNELLKIEKENSFLNEKATEAQTPSKIKETAQSLGFVSIKNIKYLTQTEAVARINR